MTKSSSPHIPEDLEQRLLACGRHLDAPPPGALGRTMQRVELAAAAGLLATTVPIGAAATTAELAVTANVVGIGTGTLVTAAGGTSGAKVAAASLSVKWFLSGLAVGVAGTGIVGAGVVAEQHWLAPSNTAVTVVAKRRNLPVPTRADAQHHGTNHANAVAGLAATATATDTEEPVEIENRPVPSNRLRSVTTPAFDVLARDHLAPSANSSVSPKRATSPSAELARELALLDHARAALERRDAINAISWLDRHAEQFPTGQLAPEAAELRTQAANQLSHTVPIQNPSVP